MHGGELVAIILFLVVGTVLTLFFYFRSRDRQLIIEKGISPELANNMFKYKWNPFLWLKLGIVVACGSVGVLIGNYLMWAFPEQHWSYSSKMVYTDANPTMMIFSIFFSLGVGFILAFYISRKMEIEEENRRK